jgi:UDP-glucose 4-epimerase
MNNENGGGIYNLGSNRGTSVNEIFAALQAVTGNTQKPIFGPPIVGETRHIYLDPTKAQSELGWSARTDLLDGLRQTAEYVRANEANP